jgi:diguanylate cyclase (GGDEF)-like protein
MAQVPKPGQLTPAGSERRLKDIVEVIQSLARLDFRRTARVTEDGDVLDAIAGGINMLGEELAAFQQSVEAQTDSLRQANSELERRALYDSLTGLPNRALFRDRLGLALNARDHNVAVVALDLDGFKDINDTLGHQAGDRMLVEVGVRLAGSIRAADTAARVGGDEFSAVLNDVDGAQARRTASRMAQKIRQPFELDGTVVRMAASFGIALSGGMESGDELARNADVALYAAKALRNGQPQLYLPGMHDPISRRQRLTSALRGALDREEISLAYQPIVDIHSGEIAGVEALARWHNPEFGDVPPAVFIPLAEEIGLMPHLGDWVLRTACDAASTWVDERQRRGRPPVHVAVNVSAVQLDDEQFVARLKTLLRRSGLASNRLVIEVTESQLVEHVKEGVPTLKALRRLGVQIAIDDFGTGYSSLTYLRHLPVDIVKIDRSFVAGIGSDSDQWMFAQAVVHLIRRLGLRMVAEGIEDAAELAHVRALGCEMAQGYYFGRPTDSVALHAALRRGPGFGSSRVRRKPRTRHGAAPVNG